jgi:hypothetical protein
MIGYILTPQQKEEIQGVFFTDSIFFNCVQDINGTWFLFLSPQDIEILPSEFQYLLTLPTGEYVPPLPPELNLN